LRADMGMCPQHARRLLESLGAGHIMTIAMREALAGARLAVRGNAPVGLCPACEAAESGARHARTLLLDGPRRWSPPRAAGHPTDHRRYDRDER